MKTKHSNEFYKLQFDNERNLLKFRLLKQWLRLKHRGVQLEQFFTDRDIDHIAVYGLGDIGLLLIDDLKESSKVIIDYLIDKNCIGIDNGLPVYSLESIPVGQQAIVITPVLVTDEIEDNIFEKKGERTTFTIEEILFELSRKNGVESDLWKI